MSAAPDIDHALKSLFGFDSFRPGQRELVEAVLKGRDALGVLPTGAGKSLTYQLPALLLEGLTVVVSPLIALMKDQVDGFNRRNKGTAVAIHSNQKGREASDCIAALKHGQASLLYIAPERLETGHFVSFLKELRPKLLVIDEAHCVSMWGHDFRPSYLALGGIAESLRPCPILALTATATPAARRDIAARLGLVDHLEFTGSFDRPNLRFEVHACSQGEKEKMLKTLLKTEENGSQIVYVGRRADADELSVLLNRSGFRAVPYHAGMSGEHRKRAQDQWLSGEKPIAVATLAFGMGIDKPDVRTVVHYQHPASLEAYYQEAGRAGRDGKPARCVLLFSGKDSSLAHFFIRNRYPSWQDVKAFLEGINPAGCTDEQLSMLGPSDMTPEQRNVALLSLIEQQLVWMDDRGLYCRRPQVPKFVPLDNMNRRRDADYARLETMLGYAKSPGCNRALLLKYFGEKLPADYRCGNCTRCDPDAKPIIEGGAKKSSKSNHADFNPTALQQEKVAEISRLLLLHKETLAKQKLRTIRPVEGFFRGGVAKDVPEEWRQLEGYGSFSYLKRAELEPLVRKALAETNIWKAKEQAPDPKLEAVLASGDVFWKSKRRAYTKTELLAREVPRQRGLLILRAFASEKDGFAPAKLAGILHGHPMMAHDHPELMQHPFWKKVPDCKYDDMLADVLTMWCKGYLEQSPENARLVRISAKGRGVPKVAVPN
ncbi:MAG TPA: ATP-dependent DNA helicase RecQ [Planctomycetota bacterium]|nr:ATP-dependent DNA helicase RecQ [Planctomycetota bacterium]